MTNDATQHGHRIGLKHQNIAADHGVERSFERECRGIAFTEADILDRVRRRSTVRRRKCRWSPICADDMTFAANHLGNQECNVARATADVEHAHPGANARREQNSARDRINDARLMAETPDLAIGMDEDIRDLQRWLRHLRLPRPASSHATVPKGRTSCHDDYAPMRQPVNELTGDLSANVVSTTLSCSSCATFRTTATGHHFALSK